MLPMRGADKHEYVGQKVRNTNVCYDFESARHGEIVNVKPGRKEAYVTACRHHKVAFIAESNFQTEGIVYGMENKMDDEKKKVKQAIALEYDPSDEAPRVVASGKGILAEKIIEKAQESSVPVHRDDKLADTLSRLDIGEMIPPELYEVVAEILVFVDAVDHRMVKESVINGGKRKG